MRYIGGKSRLLDIIHDEIKARRATSVIDIFAGSGVVSAYLSQNGYRVVSNDFMYFSYVLNRGLLMLDRQPGFDRVKVGEVMEYLNNLTLKGSGISPDECFILKNYSPYGNCERRYFQEKNALKIDLIRITIEKWYRDALLTENEYFYLLSRLIDRVPSVSNITGVYGAYLKHWDARTYKDLKLEYSDSHVGRPDNRVYNEPFQQVLPELTADLIYADPPYNSRQYLPNYHILETIARYDYPEIHGKTGIRNYGENEKSDFCIKSRVDGAFRALIEGADVRSVVISYNSEGLLQAKVLESICRDYARDNTFRRIEIPYRRFKSHDGKNKQIKELLFSFDKW